MRSDGQRDREDRQLRLDGVSASGRRPVRRAVRALVEDVSTEVVDGGGERCGRFVDGNGVAVCATPLLVVAGQGEAAVVKNAPSARLVGTITCAALEQALGTGARLGDKGRPVARRHRDGTAWMMTGGGEGGELVPPRWWYRAGRWPGRGQ